MNTTLTNIITDTDHLATLIVGLLFGWLPETTTAEVEADEPVFGIDDEELPGYSVVTREDREVEVEVYDFDPRWGLEVITTDNSGPQSAYYTTSGDNPVLSCEADLVDQKRRLSTEDVAPSKEFYSAALPYKRQHRNFTNWLLAVQKHSASPAKLRKLWNAFWTKYFSRKADGTLSEWLYGKQVASVVAAFGKYGVSRHGK